MYSFNSVKITVNCCSTENITKSSCLLLPLDNKTFTDLFYSELRSDFISKESEQYIKRIADLQKFSAKKGEILELYCSENIFGHNVIFLVGLDDKESLLKSKKNINCYSEEIGAKIFSHVKKYESVLVVTEFARLPEINSDDVALGIVSGILQRSYKFTNYLSKDKLDEKYKNNIIQSITVATTKSVDDLQQKVKKINTMVNSIFIVRDLVNEPANVINPNTYSELVKDHLKKFSNVSVDILNESDMAKLGMNLLLGVGQASDNGSKMVHITYKGKQDEQKIDLSLVGKGVTFDSGGLSIKTPSKHMETMKSDMTGSAIVFATIIYLAEMGINVNVTATMPLVENSINGKAQRPGDVVKSMSGQTVEILNTDAEGRLILGDALYYVASKHKPEHIIDLATLTGAISVALGNHYAGLMTNSDRLSESLQASGLATNEKVWRLPLSSDYDKMIDSDIADMKNVSNTGTAGSITAAQFLQRFIDNCASWAHIDIAGVSFGEKSSAFSDNGATGFGLKLITNFIEVMLCQK